MASLYCTECGAALTPGLRFCTSCGAAVVDPVPPEAMTVLSGSRAAGPGVPPPAYAPEYPGAAPARRGLSPALLALGIGLLVGVLLAGGWWVVRSRSAASSDIAAPAAASAPSVQVQPSPPTPTPDATAATVDGRYAGTMYGRNGTYDFVMALRQGPGGQVTGRIVQRHDNGKIAGTEYVSGSLKGRSLKLVTDYWAAGADGDWGSKTDYYYLTFTNSRLDRFGGRFECDICGTGLRPITGRR